MTITIREVSDGTYFPRFQLKCDDLRIGAYGANKDELFEVMQHIRFIVNKKLGETCEFKIID